MRWILLCLTCLVAPIQAGAAPEKLYPDEVPVNTGGGHLPVGPTVTRAEAIEAAYGLAAVQAAITHMGARGYIAHPFYDDAAVEPGVPATFVALAFEKPGLVTPSPDVIGAPMILIGTVRDAAGQLRTTVAGGLGFADMAARTMWTADSLPALYPGDGSWEAVPAGGGGGDDGGLRRTNPGSGRFLGPYAFTFGGTNSPEDQRFRRFMHCAAIGAGTAAMNAMWQGPPIPQRVVIQGAVLAVISVIACGVGAYGGAMP